MYVNNQMYKVTLAAFLIGLSIAIGNGDWTNIPYINIPYMMIMDFMTQAHREVLKISSIFTNKLGVIYVF